MQAVKPAKEIGGAKAAKELGIPEGTIHTWMKAVRAGKLDIGEGSHTPAGAMSRSEEITMLRRRVKEQDKDMRERAGERVASETYADRALVKGVIKQLNEDGSVKEGGIEVEEGIRRFLLFIKENSEGEFLW